jgi:hypothetical protein
MMDERNPFAQPVESEEHGTPDESPAAEPSPGTNVPDAVIKFRSCRWRSDPDAGEFCTHRDVLPFAGKEGFVPDSWCPDCQFFKLRRTPRKREPLY